MPAKRAQAALEQPPAAARHLHAQAALEFLMTYGWAILIMLVVIAVLFYLGVFNSSTSVPSSCVLPAGFTCAEFSLDSSGRLYLDLGQATGKTITVNGVGCSASGASVTALSIPVTVQTGSHAVVSDSDITCSGNYSGAFKGKISIRYQPAGAAYNKTITGDLSAPVAVVSSGQQDQWNSSYSYYRQVTVNTGVSSNLTNFPAYFILDTQHLIAYGRMNSSCKDLRVINSTKNGVMDYEIENNTCNTTNTIVWLRVPQTNAANDYTAYVFYGNTSASDAQNKPGVWQNGYAAVYHLSGDTADSTNANNAVNYGATSSSGRFGNAMGFDGASKYVDCGYGSSLNIGNGTVGLWFKLPFPISGGSNPNQIHLMGGGPSYYYFSSSSSMLFYFASDGGQNAGSNSNSWDANWHHSVVTSNGTLMTMYIDGNAQADTGNSTGLKLFAFTSSVLIGRNSGNYFNGTLDEVRISSANRSQDWIRAEYGQTYSVGSEVVN